MKIKVRKALESDKQALSNVLAAAFGREEGAELEGLVGALMADPTAQPSLSLVAADNDSVLGHILFTNAEIERPRQPVSSAILAPLSVHPKHQNRGIGGRLIEKGVSILMAAGVDLVFVLGHPTYYPTFGFAPAQAWGFEATYPIAPEHADACMVKELRPGVIGRVGGRVICADSLHEPKYWRE
jgi:putative acetyltransferase